MKQASLIDKIKELKYILPNKEKSSVGRSRDNDVVIPDCPLSATVSREHCTIIRNYKDETAFVSDNNSTYGTYLNGKKLNVGRKREDGTQLRDIWLLRNGDELKLGDYKLEVKIEEQLSPDYFDSFDENEIDGEYDIERLKGDFE